MQENKTQNRTFIENIKSTYKYAKTGKKYLIFFLLTNIILTIISIIIPVFTAKRLVVLTSSQWNKMLIMIIVIFLLEISFNLFRFLTSYLYNIFYYDVRKNIQIALTKETLKIKQSELDNNTSGIFIERINNDTDNLTDIFAKLIDYFTTIIGNLAILVTVFIINPYIGIAYIFILFIFFLVDKYTSEINYKNRKLWKKSREKTGGFISEIVRGAKDIKILDAEKSFLVKASDYMQETNDVSTTYHITRAKLRLFGGTVRDIADLGISLLYFIFLISSSLSIEYTIVLMNYHHQIIGTSDLFEQIYEVIKQYNLASNRIFGILESNEFEKETFGKHKLDNIKGSIEFKNVCFSYKENQPVINNMSFKINPTQTIGFVGPSGAGKSTIFNLITRLNVPNSGEILFDNINQDELNKDAIRGNLSVISQNAYIFNMSIKDNLKVVKNSSTDEEIIEACKLACLDEFIENLPDKYETIVGEGGVTLSGGQRQRLAIARALLLKTKILLFDEATSALDNKTQNKIQEAINNLKGDYTILIIAHRLSTVINSNKIFVIEKGQVVDSGTHEYLLENCDTYKKLYTKESTLEQKNTQD